MQKNALYYGDCHDWMREWLPDARESVDLIYLDPPFNSNTDYNMLFGTGNGLSAQARGFMDTWKWDDRAAERVSRIERATMHPIHAATQGFKALLGESGMLAYLTYMGERLATMRDLLKPSGSIYLHCDPTASHYLKALMDAVFGAHQFRNEIAWCYTGPGNTTRWFPRKHDTILFYCKDDRVPATFNRDKVRIPYEQLNVQHRKENGGGIGGRITPETVESYRQRGKVPEDYWLERRDGMSPVGRRESERIGYPTQKPVALLERIINVSSNPGDLVLDPFCGCGTAVIAAHNLGRQWIGIDISAFAIDIIQERRLRPLRLEAECFGMPQGLADARKLASEKPLDFEAWAVTRIPGLAPNERKTGDHGIDGRGILLNQPRSDESRLVLAQVKGGRSFSLSQFRDFLHVVERENAAAGIFITTDTVASSTARAEASQQGEISVGASRYPRVQLWSIADFFERRYPQLPSLADPYTGTAIQPALLS